MLELALHILDIVENSTQAGATLVCIAVTEDLERDVLTIEIKDDGHGMDQEQLGKVFDPFYTTKEVRRIGLGLPLLYQATQQCDGHFEIESQEGEGTRICAEFRHSHIDRQPVGDMAGVITALIAGNPCVDFVYWHRNADRSSVFDTREIRKEIENIPINHPEILNFIRTNIKEKLNEIG